MAQRESPEQALQRWKNLEAVQEHYRNFDDLLVEVIENVMGFNCSEIQEDIGDWIAHGPKYLMVQAQRGQAKTTIAAVYAVYELIHNPSHRVLIISAGDGMATQISNWIIQIINTLPELECMRPDRSNGDRASVEAFDVHYTLKGPEKSPSVACLGITSNMQGWRADLLIADDIESQKNSATAEQRAKIEHLTRDFISICSKGRIIWLGTPQSIDSIYNGLPGRGVAIRIWPGRYPTPEEMPDYEGYLAPLLAERIKADKTLQTGGGPTGDRGKPIDPVLLDEDTLTAKEVDQGPSYFQLQHMLSTKLSDAQRYPLKVGLLRFYGWDREQDVAPLTMNFVRSQSNLIKPPMQWPVRDNIYRIQEAGDFASILQKHMYVDPSGGGKNGDELAYGVTGFLAGRVFLLDTGGFPGGLHEENLDELTELAVKWKPQQIDIEQNFGNGALRQVWQPKLLAKHKCSIEDVWETGQKELRIIDILEPVIGSGRLVVHEDLLQDDWNRCQRYAADVRQTYSLFWQMSRITRDKGALLHDDRLDALAGSVRHWVDALSLDADKAKAAAQREHYNKMMKDPLGNGRHVPGMSRMQTPATSLAKHGLSGFNNQLRRI